MQRLGLFSRASLCLVKYVVVKTLLEKQAITQIERPHYPIWIIYPQVGNQLSKLYWENNCLHSVATDVRANVCNTPILQCC